ncbi:hypothetical protein F4824DRAFT_447781 [Ustulina deusta]|nr:hypothetical protein F4824DRAFT_447781 [Ustulina deusta]
MIYLKDWPAMMEEFIAMAVMIDNYPHTRRLEKQAACDGRHGARDPRTYLIPTIFACHYII